MKLPLILNSALNSLSDAALPRAVSSPLLYRSKFLSGLSLPLLLMTAPACAQENAQDDEAVTEQNAAPAAPSDIAPEAPSFDPDAPDVTAPPEPSAAAIASLEMIDKALKEIDDKIMRDGNSWQFQIDETQILVVSDPIAERMRIMVPIIQADSLNLEILGRVMQANFDSALDARYAIANGLLWGTYIHPLNGLTEEEFLSGLGQTISIVNTFGTSFSSGTVVFGGGDSQEIVEEQIDEQEKEREAASFT